MSNRANPSPDLGNYAPAIGGSMTRLLAARVLVDHFVRDTQAIVGKGRLRKSWHSD
jgi:hypothetical protein